MLELDEMTGGEASQAMLILGNERASRISLCLKAAPLFLLGEREAIQIATTRIRTIQDSVE